MSKDTTKIILSGSWGGGFATDFDLNVLHKDFKLAELLESKEYVKASEYISSFNDEDGDPLTSPPMTELRSLTVVTLKKGTKYFVTEYDGKENYQTIESTPWEVA